MEMSRQNKNKLLQEKWIGFSFDTVRRRSDLLINYFLIALYIGGLLLSFFYNTWLVGITTGSACLFAYYISKRLLPKSDFYQYVLSIVFGIFMAQYIYQMHGLFEMHFIAFIGGALLVTHQNWKLQIPLFLFIVIHHSLFAYLQYKGIQEIYFTPAANMNLQTFIIHIFLVTVFFFICGFWSFTLSRNTIRDGEKNVELMRLQDEEEKAEILATANAKLEKAKRATEEINEKLNHEIAEREGKANELKKVNEHLDQFAYIVSHDLRAPLRAISSLSGWIKEDLGNKLSEENRKNMNLLENRVNRMDALISGILEYSKVGRMKVATEIVDVNKLLAEIIDLLAPPPAFSITIQPGIPSLTTEKILLQQVFSNLINNAIKYNDKDKGKIDISMVQSEEFYEFTVADNGPGIAPEHHHKIFGIFQTLEQKDKVESTGIGLGIVKKIIDEHSGKIWIDSEKGSGAKFIFTWPKT